MSKERISKPPAGDGEPVTKRKPAIKKPVSKKNPPLPAQPKTEENTMEVHHHPEVEKKGIKEYLLEGLMIFLAVTMGFFAESLREHINENNRSKEYAVTLYSDLKADTTELNDYLTYFRFATNATDTLMRLLASNDPRKIPAGELYWFGLMGGAYHTFTPNDATLLEMENSGSLRFFGDKIINRKLAQYNQLCQSMKLAEEKENAIYAEVRKARAQLFEFKYNEEANSIFHATGIGYRKVTADPYGKKLASRQHLIDSFKKSNPPLLSYDKTLFNEYIEMIRSRFLYLKVANADTLLHHSTELINLLNKKYKLDEE